MSGSDALRHTRPGAGAAGRMEIVAAAAAVFSERGYAATSIDDIADRLGASKGRVYHYYRSKADVFLDVHRVAMETMLDRIGPLVSAEGDASERLGQMAREHARLLMAEFEMQVVAVQGVEMHLLQRGSDAHRAATAEVIRMRDEYEQLFVDVLTAGVDAGEFRAAPPRLLSKVVLGALNWITMWYRPESGTDPEGIADQFATFVVEGVRA
jgi:AcrR family transcriptional regulator